MISFISGILKEKFDDQLVIAINENIWLNISAAKTQQYSLDQKINFYTFMHWSQENGPTIYGFQNRLEKQTFMLLIDCNGIGPKAALSILNQSEPDFILSSVQEKNSQNLSKLNGIGNKKAEQIILSLSSKVTKLLNDGTIKISTVNQSYFADLHSVLLSLSYSKQEIESSLNYLRGLDKIPQGFDEALRKALSFLTKNR